MDCRSKILETASPGCGRVLPTIYPGDKHERGVRLNFAEESNFSGICSLGANQLIECYGYHASSVGFNRFDFISLCEKCRYATKETEICYERYNPKPYSYFDPMYLADRFNDYLEEEHPKAFVYFVSDGQFVKIGKANNVQSRLNSLQCGNVKELKLLAIIPCKNEKSATSVEGALHTLYSQYKIFREWYDILPQITKKLGITSWFSPGEVAEDD